MNIVNINVEEEYLTLVGSKKLFCLLKDMRVSMIFKIRFVHKEKASGSVCSCLTHFKQIHLKPRLNKSNQINGIKTRTLSLQYG